MWSSPRSWRFPAVVRPGESFQQTTVHQFYIEVGRPSEKSMELLRWVCRQIVQFLASTGMRSKRWKMIDPARDAKNPTGPGPATKCLEKR